MSFKDYQVSEHIFQLKTSNTKYRCVVYCILVKYEKKVGIEIILWALDGGGFSSAAVKLHGRSSNLKYCLKMTLIRKNRSYVCFQDSSESTDETKGCFIPP